MKRINAALWIVQGLLAALFLFAGGIKFVLPAETLTAGTSLSAGFLRFIGVCEILGALGLILPGLLRIRPELTSIAAAGLTIIMIGAVVVSLPQGVAVAVVPFIVGLLCVFVAYGRSRFGPGSVNIAQKVHQHAV